MEAHPMSTAHRIPVRLGDEPDEQDPRCRHAREADESGFRGECNECRAEAECRRLDAEHPRDGESWADRLEWFRDAVGYDLESALDCLMTDREMVAFVAELPPPAYYVRPFVARYYDALDYRRAADQALRRTRAQLDEIRQTLGSVKYGPDWHGSMEPCREAECATCGDADADDAAREVKA